MRWKTYIYLNIFLIGCIYGQDLQFRHITIDDGLSQSTVNCIFQDSQGFIWLGTENGLNRYDGYEFIIFKHEPSDSNSISHSWIWDIFEDSQKNLWIATWNGLNKYNPNQNTITRYLPNPDEAYSISGARPTSICEDQDSLLWIATWGGGINIYDPETDQFTNLQHDPGDPHSLPDNRVRNIFYSADNNILAATWNGFSIIEKKGNGPSPEILSREDIYNLNRGYQITNYQHNPANPQTLGSNEVSSVVEDKAGQIWIGTFRGGLHLFHKESHAFTHYRHDKNNQNSLSSDDIISLFVDRYNNLWIGTVNEGLNIYKSKSNSFDRYKHDPARTSSLNGNNVFSIFEDKSGLIWVGTNGLNIYDKKLKRFHHYYSSNQNSYSLNHNRVTKFFEDPTGIIWIATEGGGLNKFDSETDLFTHFTHNPQNFFSLSNNNISSLTGDDSGNIWIGTRGGGLNKFNPRSGKFQQYKEEKNIPETEGIYFINDLCIDRNQKLWIATYDKGLIQYDILNDKYIHFTGNPNDESALLSNYLLSLYVDSKNNIWVGSWGGGLSCYLQAEKRFIRYTHDPDNSNTIGGNIINTIYESQKSGDGVLWVGTDFGLSYMNLADPGPENFKHIFEKDGLPSNVICGILEDEAGNLWISTNSGICNYNPVTQTFQTYDKNDGLQSNEFIAGSFLKRSNGQFLFGGINGFNSFLPDSIKKNSFEPPVVFTSFKIFDKPISLNQSLNSLEKVDLQYQQNFFSFEFASLDYTMPVKNQYAYMLEGFDKEWIYSGSRRYVSYTNLDPGNYVFRVKATNSDGVWNHNPASLNIIIIPPFWMTWWAYGLYSFLIIGSVLGMIRMRSLKLEKEKKQLEKIVNERTNEIQTKNIMLAEQAEKLQEMDQVKSRFFANISHEFRTPLTLIKGPAEEMANNNFRGKPEKAYSMILRNANRLLRLINQLLDLSKLESGSMELKAKLQPITPLIKVVINTFSTLAESRNILLQFVPPSQEPEIYFDRDKMEKILYNLLSNAFKFTPEHDFITVTLDMITSSSERFPIGAIKLSVQDSGIGIPSKEIKSIFDRFTQVNNANLYASDGSGIGLALTKELVELHHGEIHIASTPNEGTKFDIILPLGKDHLKPYEITDKEEPDTFFEDEKNLQLIDLNGDIDVPATEDSGNNNHEQHVVLIVEDHVEVREYIREQLSNEYQILEAGNGNFGVQLAKEHLPDLIISDVMMPEMDGYQLTNILKQNALTSHIPIIMLTAKVSDEARIEGLETGADAYMAKPFNAQELEVRVKKLIENRSILRDKFKNDFILEPASVKADSLDDEFIPKGS